MHIGFVFPDVLWTHNMGSKYYNTFVLPAAIRIELSTESIKPFGKTLVLHVMLKEFTKTCLIYFQSIYWSLTDCTIQILFTVPIYHSLFVVKAGSIILITNSYFNWLKK